MGYMNLGFRVNPLGTGPKCNETPQKGIPFSGNPKELKTKPNPESPKA